MNKILEVAKLLGVEVNEEFMVDGFARAHRINEDGIVEIKTAGVWWKATHTCLQCLITGIDTIKKKPFKPHYKEKYWYIDINGKSFPTIYYGDGLWDILRYKIGNCFRTKEEITQEIIDKYVAFFKSDEQIEV